SSSSPPALRHHFEKNGYVCFTSRAARHGDRPTQQRTAQPRRIDMLVFTQTLRAAHGEKSGSALQLQEAPAMRWLNGCLRQALNHLMPARRRTAAADALRQLLAQGLPVQLESAAEIREIARLRDAGLLWATIPPAGMLAPQQER